MTLLLGLILLAQPGPPARPAPCSPTWLAEFSLTSVRCAAESGPNWSFAFAVSAEFVRSRSLELELDARRDFSRRDFDSVITYAAANPDDRFFHDEIFVLDADRPELLALSSMTSQYAGGAHPWHASDTLIWDRAANREIGLYDLFADPAAARAELQRELCPALLTVRRRHHERSGGRFGGGCEAAPEEAGLDAGEDGRIDTLRVRYAELDGYAGGEYEVYVPVTPRLIAAMKPGFRAAFRLSSEPTLGCNTNLIDPACAARQRQ
ncbi:MAG TPA: hypothetical protein VGB08_09405 [Allosphingosinicella sp.]|jgi:hypothetical protein